MTDLSLGDIQAIHSEIAQIRELLLDLAGAQGTAGGGSRKLTSTDVARVKEVGLTAQQATRILFRFNHILSHLGLPENISAVIRKFQQLIFMARMVLMSIHFLSMGTGYGTVMGTLGFISTGFSALDWVGSMMGETQA